MATSSRRAGAGGIGYRIVLFVAIYCALFLVLGLLGRLIGFSAPMVVGAAVQLGVTVLIYVAVRRRANGEVELPGSEPATGSDGGR